MPVRPVRKEEMLEFEKISTVAFVGSLDVEKCAEAFEKEENPEKHCIANFSDDGVMLAGMALPEYDMRYDGHVVKMTGIGGVASLPEYRFGGAIRQCFDFAFDRMKETGAVFSALYPFSHSYYRKFGYELCQPEVEVTLPISALKKYRHTGWAKMLQKGEMAKEVSCLHEAFYAAYNASIVRSDEMWKNWAKHDPYKDKLYRYLIGDDTGPLAYAVIAARKIGDYENAALIKDAAFLGREGLNALLGFLYRFSAQYAKAKFIMPADIPFMSLLDNPYEVETRYSNQAMFRVVNAKEALRLMKHPEGASYNIAVRDELIAENDGTFSVSCSGGEVSVQRTEAAADITVDIRTLAQLCLGYLDLKAARMKSDVSITGNEDTLRAVFTKKESFLTDYF